ncbi:class I SAM-dependent methyltransferase [Leifsonia sp. McL0607]|uniref:class I SAM-dependent methyltransferase n=1 Tax=Leifsonia sp. McL0607 TaxID=3415672 RepID=UPI003CEA454A
MAEKYGERLFLAGTQAERDRLDAMSETFDGASHAALGAVGPMPGWHCLDAGAGKGSIARWLASQVGPSGRVLAVDLDTSGLESSPHAGVDVLSGDITDPALPLGTYDLVHARFLLLNLRSREEILTRFVDILRPGGYLVISDTADLGTPYVSFPPFSRVTHAFFDVMAEIGTDPAFGLRHHGLFAKAGLTDIRNEVYWPTLGCASPMSRALSFTFVHVADRIIATGKADREDIDATIEYLNAPETSDALLAMITTIGRKPA